MKSKKLKPVFITFLLLLGVITTSVAQEKPEVQPLGLIDHKITFYDVQMDVESVDVIYMDQSKKDYEKPIMTINSEAKSITIDFSNCAIGEYLIYGTRGDLKLEYSVER